MNISQRIIFSFVAVFTIVFLMAGASLLILQSNLYSIKLLQRFYVPVKQIMHDINEEIGQKYTGENIQTIDDYNRWKIFIEPKIQQLNELRYLYESEALSNDIEEFLKILRNYEKKPTAANFKAIRLKIKAIYRNETLNQDRILNNIYKTLYNLNYIIVGGLFLLFLIMLITALQTINPFINNVEKIQEVLHRIAQGEVVDEQNIKVSQDFDKLMIATQQVSAKINQVSRFAQSIGEGNFDHEFEATSIKDILGSSLLQMREKLKEANLNEHKRNWANEGYNQLARILSDHTNSSIEVFCQEVLTFLVDYIGANQGFLFLKKELKNNKVALELVAAYAYHQRKFLEKIVIVDGDHGEGLLGQAYISKKTIHLTELPPNYITIGSGLGEAKPTNLLIIPIKYNNEVESLLEIASFQPFEKHHIQFLERSAESISAAFMNIRNNIQTKNLLQELQTQTQMLKKQEEEMKANLIKLQIAQEQAQLAEREQQKLLQSTRQLANIVENHPDFIGYFNMKGEILYINPAGLRMLGISDLNDILGKSLTIFYSPIEAEKIFNQYLPQAIEQKNAFFETQIKKIHTEDLIPVEQLIAISLDEVGNPNGFSITVSDITLRKQQEQNLKAYQQTLLKILDKIPGKIFLKDANGVILLANSEVARVYNRTVEQLLGTSDFDFFEPSLAQSYREQELEIMELGAKTYIQEEELTGELRYLQTTKMPFYIDYKQEIGLLGIQYDITENIVLEKTVRELKTENRKLKQQLERQTKNKNS
ncbi:MAG: PAS domain-containing protein [Microscillaceae bacterium]|nr:PAS domain-containing protein [Microscillaceae bacterium]MDW8460506.1 PAS domain-containing protein [Cytophagales bacterium]